MNRSLLTLLFAVSSAQAFMMAPSGRMAPRSAALNLMTEEESEALATHVNFCLESECGIDDVDDLLSTLKSQQAEIQGRVNEVGKMIKSLEKVNGLESGDEKVDQVRETVRAIFRVFQLGDKASGNDYPSLTKPMGYPGDVGSGPSTAYDALPPKQWKSAP